MTRRSLRALACAAAALGCATVGGPGPGPPSSLRAPDPAPAASTTSPTVATGLTFAVEPPDAEVVLDGRLLGKVRDLASGGLVALPPGRYRVSLRRGGYTTWRAEVAVAAGGAEVIRVQLVPGGL